MLPTPASGCAWQRNAESVAAHRCTVVEHRPVNARYRYLRLMAKSNLADATRPGQFYQLKCPATADFQPFLLRPMSVYGVGPESGTIEFLYNVAGTGTTALSTAAVGSILEIVGPLGNTFTLERSDRQILVLARGVGLATMAPLIRYAAAAGTGVTAAMSARSPRDLMRDEFLRGTDAAVHSVFDSDGSSSMESMEGLLRGLLARTHHSAVYTCGSHRLLMLLQRVLRDFPEVRGEVALEQRMACGMGVCLSCVRLFDCEGHRRFLRVCREGPVFPVREVVDEVEFG